MRRSLSARRKPRCLPGLVMLLLLSHAHAVPLEPIRSLNDSPAHSPLPLWAALPLILMLTIVMVMMVNKKSGGQNKEPQAAATPPAAAGQLPNPFVDASGVHSNKNSKKQRHEQAAATPQATAAATPPEAFPALDPFYTDESGVHLMSSDPSAAGRAPSATPTPPGGGSPSDFFVQSTSPETQHQLQAQEKEIHTEVQQQHAAAAPGNDVYAFECQAQWLNCVGGCKKRVLKHPRGVVCKSHHDFIPCAALCGNILHVGCVVETLSGRSFMPDPNIPWLCAKCTPVSMKVEVGVASLSASKCTPDSNPAATPDLNPAPNPDSNPASGEHAVDDQGAKSKSTKENHSSIIIENLICETSPS